MDLYSLLWPPLAETVRTDSPQIGFGGGLSSTLPTSRIQYVPVDNVYSAQAELRRLEKIEAPIAPNVEKEQQVVETPQQVQEENKQDRREHEQQQHRLKHQAEATWDQVDGVPPNKKTRPDSGKRKKTRLF